jgi:hypothetical protein
MIKMKTIFNQIIFNQTFPNQIIFNQIFLNRTIFNQIYNLTQTLLKISIIQILKEIKYSTLQLKLKFKKIQK